MNRLLSLILLVLLVSCGSTQLRSTPTANIPSGPEGVQGVVVTDDQEPELSPEPAPEIPKTVVFTDATRMSGLMNFFASDDLKGREAGSEGIAKAADFIEYWFLKVGVAPYYNNYRDTINNYRPLSYNMVGFVPGNDPVLKDEYILIGAHYDHIGIINATNGDNIANGANDNASGTSTVLELARYFAEKRNNKRSLIFALFSAEEKGLVGSWHLARRMKEEGSNLYVMLNFEMTGVPLKDKDYFLYITGYKKSNLAEISNKYGGEGLIGYLPTANDYNLFQRSDNYPFHEVLGVPSHTYCTFDFTNFDYYHKVDDEVEEMDFEHMAEIVNRMIPAILGIANARESEIKYN